LEAHILRRPFSVYAAEAGNGQIQLLYQTVGQGTSYLTSLSAGTELDLIGPVGRGWQPPTEAQKVLLIGGGLGVAPLYLLTAAFSADVELHVVMGAQNADMLICRLPYLTYVSTERLHITTDDGSVGLHGFTTTVAKELLAQGGFDYIATCGPEPMQRIIAEMAAEAGVFCEVSLERRMACGLGACLSCRVDTIVGSKRACVDGPVFNATEVIW
jgi:dihydroorotate dehydrogenase electron transfer subunit